MKELARIIRMPNGNLKVQKTINFKKVVSTYSNEYGVVELSDENVKSISKRLKYKTTFKGTFTSCLEYIKRQELNLTHEYNDIKDWKEIVVTSCLSDC